MSTAIILAAGTGTRMRSALPKAMHPIAGQPMLRHLLASCAAVFDRIVVVVGPDAPALAALAAPHDVVVQHDRRGTAHAALQAEALFGDGNVAILYADNPLISAATLRRLLEARRSADLALLAMRPPDPGRYGRVVIEQGRVRRIVEYADATEPERAIGLCNAGVFCAAAAALRAWLHQVPPAPGGEYYLTDIVPHATCAMAVEAPYDELRGINTRAELAAAETTVQQDLRARAMALGVTMTAPDTVFLSFDTQLARDVTIAPHVVFAPGVSIGEGCQIRAYSHLEGCTVAAGAVIGPFARLRPGAVIETGAHVGNFVELKATRLGAGAKVNHLSYIGDAEVGEGTNIGAGTITCNYDGVAKHRTSIGADVFIGSSATLVAPLSIGDRAFIAAGSVITAPVEADALAFGRARQEVKPGMAARLRHWLREKSELNKAPPTKERA
jgi:bifunctional UDP-N-acetylglucosamine pyrophosphorylase/glucosamine-1-phosphate N-acetyltransferase